MSESLVADLETLPSCLATRKLGRSFVALATTESTMDDARRALEAGAAEGHLVVADTQTRGRGTHGRTWSSPAGTDLYASFVLRPDVPLDVLPTSTLAVGLGLLRGLAPYVGDAPIRIKWPNDVLVGGRKVAGILVETRASSEGVDGVVVGFGINCNRVAFPDEVRTTATSLALASGRTHARVAVLAEVLLQIERALEVWSTEGPGAVAKDVDAQLAYVGGTARFDGAEVTVLGVTHDGGLRIAEAGVERTVYAGRLEPA